MSISTYAQLMMLTDRWVRDNYYRPGRLATPVPLTADTDLIGSAILDSVGFLELLAYVEQLTGEELDLSAVDPAALTTLRGICSLADTSTVEAPYVQS